MENLDLFAEEAGGPLLIEELPDGDSMSLVACVISTIASYATASDCAGTASTITSMLSFAG